MIVWIINHYAISPKQSGGTRHFSFAQELIKRGHDVTLFLSCFHPWDQDSSRRPWRTECIEGVRLVSIKSSPYQGNSWGRIKNMLVFAGRFWTGRCFRDLPVPDVIVGSSPHPFAALAAERVASRLNASFVLEVRDLWPLSLIEVAKVSPKHPFTKLLGLVEKYLYRRATRIITLPQHAARHMVKLGADPDKIVWISNGVDLSYVPNPRPATPNGRFTIMYAGAHGIANNLDCILDAAILLQKTEKGKDLLFRFVGEGTQKERLMRRVELERIKNVIFEPAVAKSDIYDKLQEADMFLATPQNLSLYQLGISPNKLFDYMATARPIVFGALAHNAAVEAGAAIPVDCQNKEELARAILTVREMPASQRWEMGKRGREHVEMHYNFELLSSKFEEVLADSVDKFRRRTPKEQAYSSE